MACVRSVRVGDDVDEPVRTSTGECHDATASYARGVAAVEFTTDTDVNPLPAPTSAGNSKHSCSNIPDTKDCALA